MRKAVAFLGAAAIGFVAWACSDTRQPGTPLEIAPSQARGGGAACNLSGAMDAARRYLSTPYQNTVVEQLRTLETNLCALNTANEQLAFQILSTVETAVEAGVGGPAAEGAKLVNGVLQCCIKPGLSFTLDAKALGAGGLFGVRGMMGATNLQNTGAVFSRDPVTILYGGEGGVQPVAREAIFAVRPRTGGWDGIAGGATDANSYTDDVLVLTGFPFDQTYYQLDEAPNFGFQSGSQVDVIVCFVDDHDDPANADPHPAGQESYQARVKRNGVVVLQTVAGTDQFCAQNGYGPATETASSPAAAALTALVDAATEMFMPESLGAAALFTDRTSISFGGGAGFFSKFSGVTAQQTGAGLEWVVQPPSVVQSTNTAFTVQLRAKTGGGAPLELVDVTLIIINNNGTPAEIVAAPSFQPCVGGPVSTPAVGCTRETEGGDAVTSITLKISKPGGYNLCATGAGEGFTFPQVCSRRFNVRN